MDLQSPPPPAEPLEASAVSQALSLTVGELTLSLDRRFIPDRVGSESGTTSLELFGQLQPQRMQPGTDYQTSGELGEHIVLRRVRLGRYRWLISEISLAPPCVNVDVDRVALAPKQVVRALATGEHQTFWLSTLGVDNLELENRANPLLPTFQDYVEIRLWAYEQNKWDPWRAHVSARRVVAGYDTVWWERQIAVGESVQESVTLGDHQLELLEVVWVDNRDLHVRVRLTRGETATGMKLSPPPEPFFEKPR